MSRVDIPEEERQDFFLYVDEFQNFATESFASILSEARKYRLALILGHQYISQLIDKGDSMVSDSVCGNVGTIITFRVGAEDAEFLEKEFQPEFIAEDLVGLPKYNVYLKLMINGITGAAFSAETMPPLPKPEISNREKIIKVSRERYSVSRKIIEEKISKWTGTMSSKEVVRPQESTQVLYDAQCSLCKKWTKVIFPPSPDRPVYCKPCLKKIKNDREGVQEREPSMSLREAVGQEPVNFSQKRKESPADEEKKPKRKEVNIEELKKTLEDSLKEVENRKEDEKPQGA